MINFEIKKINVDSKGNMSECHQTIMGEESKIAKQYKTLHHIGNHTKGA